MFAFVGVHLSRALDAHLAAMHKRDDVASIETFTIAFVSFKNKMRGPCQIRKALQNPPRFHNFPPSMISKVLLLIKQIRPRTAQIDNLRTPISILLEPGALEAVKRVRDALAATDDAFVLIVAKGAFVADSHERGRAHVAVADGALAVAFVAQTAQGYAGLFAAHY